MLTMEQVLQYLEHHCALRPGGAYPREREIGQVELLGPYTVSDVSTLYLKPEEGTLCLWIREEEGLKAVPLQGDCTVETLYRSVRDLLDSEARLSDRINRMYRMLSVTGGLKAVIEAAEEYLQYPVSVLDASYNMIETSPKMKMLKYGLKKVQSRIVLDEAEIESLKRLQIERKIYENQQAFVVDTEDHPDSQWIFCAIRVQNVMAGYVAVCLPKGAEVADRDLRFTTALAGVCSVEMQKHDFFVTRTGMKYENFLIELLEGRFDSVNMISSRLELLDRKFCRFFCIAVFRCGEPHNSDLFNKSQMSTLRAVYPNSMSVVYKDAIVLFLNQDEPILLNEKQLRPLEEFAQRNRMKVGISQPFSDILKINIYYQQAINVLDIGEVQEPVATCYPATELLPHYLFSNCSYTELEVGIHHHIFWLQDYDERYHTDFIETLRTYLECDRSAAKAAEKLHLHRSTFFYRIKKLEELLDVSLNDSKLLFLYELSFKIWDYLSK